MVAKSVVVKMRLVGGWGEHNQCGILFVEPVFTTSIEEVKFFYFEAT